VAKERSSLQEITIRGLGVIESAELEIAPGFTVLTGETGAGKTMVLTALGLILGAKSDSDFVRKGEERLIVTGRFDVTSDIASKVEELDGEIENGTLLISRSVTSQGKSKVLIGGTPSTASAISELADDLVEIHAQSSSIRLSKPAIQRELLDAFGQLDALLNTYLEHFHAHDSLSRKISALEKQLKERDREVAELKEFADEFGKVNPQNGELELIENELSRLGSVESINTELTAALNYLSDEESSAINSLQLARRSLESIKGKDSDLDSLVDSYLDSMFSVQESTGGIARYLSALEADPRRFEELQQRKAAIAHLLKKFGKGNDKSEAFAQLVLDGNSAQERLADLNGGEERLEELRAELVSVFGQLKSAADKLSKARAKSAVEISKEITSELAALSMPTAQIVVNVQIHNLESISSYSLHGCDDVQILFTSHSGGNLLPLSKAASGGELSRVMLAIEIVIAAKSPIGTYVFDEVDAGVGGKAAVEVGRRLAKLAKNSQVIVVTHLAQVAVWADQHLVVKKSETGSVTQSDVSSVKGEARKIEIARLLSGQEGSETAREHAAELLEMVSNSVIS